jgi:NAD-dependent deacetylase
MKRIAVLSGAGISTDSGIPDYRGQNGVWTRNPASVAAFTLDNFTARSEVRQQFWSTYVGHAAWTAKPNAAHLALAGLEQAGLAVRILTQNVDGLHQKAGHPARKVLELHGNLHETCCMSCGIRTPTSAVMTRVESGEADPACTGCGGILKPGVVLFGQYLDDKVLDRARKIAAVSELFIAVGSTLQVEPAASLCLAAVEAGAKLVIVNRDPTPYDRYADEVITDPIGEAIPKLCSTLT